MVHLLVAPHGDVADRHLALLPSAALSLKLEELRNGVVCVCVAACVVRRRDGREAGIYTPSAAHARETPGVAGGELATHGDIFFFFSCFSRFLFRVSHECDRVRLCSPLRICHITVIGEVSRDQ